MKIHLESGAGQYAIRRYAPGEVTVNETTFTASMIVTPKRLISDWPPGNFDDLAASHIEMLARLEPEVVLIGTGLRLRFPLPGLFESLMRARIGYEIMDTGAACRTYNILMGERRRVVAGLLMIEAGPGQAV